MVDHDAPHQPRGCRDKVGPALPDRLRIIDQAQIGFVENGGGLQGVASTFPAHVMVREPVQFGLHEREQLLKRSLVSAAPLAEQLSDLLSRGRGRRHTGCSTPQILTRSRDFYRLTASLEYLAQSWWVLSGISALGGRSTFMSHRRKQTRRTDVTTEKEILETTNLIKDLRSRPKI